MVAVKSRHDSVEIEIRLRIFLPWQREEIFKICRLDAIIGSIRGEPLQFPDLAVKMFLRCRVPILVLAPLHERFQIIGVRIPEFLANLVEFLTQEIVAVKVGHILLHLLADFETILESVFIQFEIP